MTEQTELLAGAVKNLRNAIYPLAYEQPYWDGVAAWCDPLYTRMRETQTSATNTCGAPAQASKAPTRMDILAWLCDIDAAVAEYPGTGRTTLHKLQDLHEQTWTPDDLRLVKAITRNCERWTENARDILGDNPPHVPLRQRCPLCTQYWVTRQDGTRDFALKATASMDNWHAVCGACKTVWYTPAEKALFRRMLDTPAS